MATRRRDETPIEELSDRQLRSQVKKARQTIDAIDRLTPAEAVRTGVHETLARYEAAVTTAEDAGEELRRRRHDSLPDRLRFARALRDGQHEPHPAVRWLDAARRYSAPELQGETLVADRLSEEDAGGLEKLVKRKREIVNDEHAEPLTDDETATWERLLGKAAGDENMFERKRKEAAVKTKFGELKDQRKVASLPRQPLLADAGTVQLPRFAVHSWLVGDEARQGAWSLMDLGLLAALLGAFANDDPSVFVGGQFDGEGTDRALVVPGGVGSDVRMHGRIAGSPMENGSGFVRVKAALAVLQRNRWVTVEQTVAEMRIRLGERAPNLNTQSGE